MRYIASTVERGWVLPQCGEAIKVIRILGPSIQLVVEIKELKSNTDKTY